MFESFGSLELYTELEAVIKAVGLSIIKYKTQIHGWFIVIFPIGEFLPAAV